MKVKRRVGEWEVTNNKELELFINKFVHSTGDLWVIQTKYRHFCVTVFAVSSCSPLIT